MKNFKYYINLFLIFCMGLVNAQTDNLDSVVKKGKSDLVQILKQSKGQFNFGISVEDVEQSKPGEGIPYREIDFDKLLNYNEQEAVQRMSKEVKVVIPLLKDSRVIATITATPNGKVSELINHRYRHELNKLPREVTGRNFEKVNIIYIPNLTAIVYTAGDRAYTSHNNRDISDGISTQELMKELKSEAIKFQREYGEKLKEGRLLN